jgi:hypothetical protein
MGLKLSNTYIVPCPGNTQLMNEGGRGSHGRRFCMPWACPNGRDQPTINADSALIVATTTGGGVRVLDT